MIEIVRRETGFPQLTIVRTEQVKNKKLKEEFDRFSRTPKFKFLPQLLKDSAFEAIEYTLVVPNKDLVQLAYRVDRLALRDPLVRSDFLEQGKILDRWQSNLKGKFRDLGDLEVAIEMRYFLRMQIGLALFEILASKRFDQHEKKFNLGRTLSESFLDRKLTDRKRKSLAQIGREFSPKSRFKMSQAAMKRQSNPETRTGNPSFAGRKHSPETIEKMKESAKSRPAAKPETRKKISEAARRRKRKSGKFLPASAVPK